MGNNAVTDLATLRSLTRETFDSVSMRKPSPDDLRRHPHGVAEKDAHASFENTLSKAQLDDVRSAMLQSSSLKK
jgi:hypothetical protein